MEKKNKEIVTFEEALKLRDIQEEKESQGVLVKNRDHEIRKEQIKKDKYFYIFFSDF